MASDRWSRVRADLAFGGAFTLLGALVLRLYGLQVVDHDSYAAAEARQSRAIVDLKIARGEIRDARGQVLAISVPGTSIAVDPTKLSDRAAATSALARALGIDAADVAKRLAKPTQFVWLRRFASDAQVAAVRALKLPGMIFETEFDRRYPHGPLLAHALGSVNVDELGVEGVEKTLDAALRGGPGSAEVEVDARRRPLEYPAGPGRTLDASLTVDYRFQEIVEEEIDAVVEKFAPKWAAVVAIDPRTGAVLAIANRPGFDPNEPAARGADARRNRVVTDPYEPGSTFKPFVVAAALEEGLVTPLTKFDCEQGAWRTGSRVLHDHDPFGILTLTDVVAKSSNIGAAKVGIKLGQKKLHAYVREFGFGARTGVDLPAEGPGLVYPLERWTSFSITSVPMGHELSVTPLQLAAAMSAIANGGTVLKPHLVKRVGAGAAAEPKPLRRVISAETAAKVRAMLAEAMVSGTGREIRVEGVPLAGKTGTTQKIDRHGEHTGYISSFVGFAPVEKARVVIAVVVDEPKGAYYGAAVAAPVFGNIVRRGLSLLGD